jgi:hypothetical protein
MSRILPSRFGVNHRRLAIEPMEERAMLSIGAPPDHREVLASHYADVSPGVSEGEETFSYSVNGPRIGRLSMRLASSSPMNCSLAGSQRSLRFSSMAMLPR